MRTRPHLNYIAPPEHPLHGVIPTGVARYFRLPRVKPNGASDFCAQHYPKSVIPTGVARFFPACGFCTPGYAAEGPLFDASPAQTKSTSTPPRHSERSRLIFSSRFAPANRSACGCEESLFDRAMAQGNPASAQRELTAFTEY